MTENEQAIFDAIPSAPAGATFKPVKVGTVSLPHPYCITSKHLQYAHGHILDAYAIEEAEKKGACCDICLKSGNGILSYKQHENHLTLYVQVEDNKDLNAVEGLHSWLVSKKEVAEQHGIQRFAFPTGGQLR